MDTANLTDELMLTFAGSAAQEESMSISGNMRWSYKHRMQSGKFITCIAPFGYRLENGRFLVVEDAEAETVRYIFDSYLAGISVSEIAAELNRRGITKRYGGESWRFQQIHSILKNEKYIGDALVAKRCTTDTLPFRKVTNKGQKDKYYIKNSHPPIISREAFVQAQSLIDSRRSPAKPKATYPLTRKIQCGECGAGFRRKVCNDKVYWVCDRHYTKADLCGNGQIPEPLIHQAFTRMVNKLRQNSVEILHPLLTGLKELKTRANAENVQITEINRQLAELAKQNLTLADIAAKGYMDSDFFIQQTNELGAKIAKLKQERQRLMSDDEGDDIIEATQTLIETIEEIPAPLTEFDAAAFGNIVSKIIAVSRAELRLRLINGLEFTERL